MAHDAMLPRGGGMPDERGALRRIFRDMDGAPADERAAAGAGAELRQCHSNRHETILFFDAGIAADRSHAAHAKPGGSRKRDAPQMPGIRRFQRLSSQSCTASRGW
ncbi:hypothetical protein GCM10023232_04340 [Sphingosinicella ginsenosidimutans]|uniref:hypothetical protein n=1 Tax=Allosphingosinicella ginsenosidimutans TaxID=1176539 RepID=UPI00131561B1|nr:hypothetical protein [Sphingosinicella ginsenosidimutans]